jgi:sulfatase maturation enzyme AslB (radical SAM superfamily)
MTTDIVESIIKRLDNLISTGNNIHLDWFGGEPLLGYNKVIKPIIQSVVSHPNYSK